MTVIEQPGHALKVKRYQSNVTAQMSEVVNVVEGRKSKSHFDNWCSLTLIAGRL